jgi:hypothetical protein
MSCTPLAPPLKYEAGFFFWHWLFLLYPSYQAASLKQQGNSARMTELLIGTVSWLATFGFIAAAIAEAFRWPRRGTAR